MINVLVYVLQNAIELSLSVGIIILMQKTILKKNPVIAKGLWIVLLISAFCPINLYDFEFEMNSQGLNTGSVQVTGGGISPFWILVLAIWLGVAVAVYMLSVIKHRMLCRNMRRLSRKEDNNIYLCKADRLAFTYGFFNTKIVISEDLADEKLKYVLNHESQHVASKDNLIKLIYLIVCCIYWFSPVLWLGRRHLEYIIELCCDDKATSGYSRADIQGYVKCLSFMAGCDLDELMTDTAFCKEHSETYNRIAYLLDENESGSVRRFFGRVLAVLTVLMMFVGVKFIPVEVKNIDGVEYVYSEEAEAEIINIEDVLKPAIGYNDDGTVAWIYGTHLE